MEISMDEHRHSGDRRQLVRRSIDRREKNIDVSNEHRHNNKRRASQERREENRRES